MKIRNYKRVLSMLLVVSMLIGQFMVSTAMAANETVIIDDSSDNIITVEPTATAEPSAPIETAAPTASPGELPVPTEDGGLGQAQESPAPVTGGEASPTPAASDSGASPAPSAGPVTINPDTGEAVLAQQQTVPGTPALLAAAENGGLSIKITSSQTSVNDGDSYTFTVSIADSDLVLEPNIVPGNKLTIQLPEFLTAADMDAVLKDCFAYFEKDYTYDPDNHSLTLTFKENSSGTWANIQFSITMQVNTIGYDGNGESKVEISLGETVESEIGVSVGTGTGTGEPQEKPYLQKNIWSNKTQSQNGLEGSYVMKDPDAPIGYAVAFGVNSNYTGSVTLTDNMSGGNLTLCDVGGNTGAALASCISLFIDGTKLTGTDSGGSLVFTGTTLGTVTIKKESTGFSVTCTDNTNIEQPPVIVDVVVRYHALVTGDANDITNAVSLSIDGVSDWHDSQTIRRYDNEGLVVNKQVLSGGEGKGVIDIDEANNEVTFRIVLTQYGTGSIYKNGETITFDKLEDCFSFDSQKVTVHDGAPFKLEPDTQDGQKINIVKVGDAAIPTGIYTIDFTVTVDPAKLQPGEQAENTVGNTVWIRRKAKLTINKTWTGENNRGSGARFELLNGSSVISNTGAYSAGESFTLYIQADKLNFGTHSYTLRETVDENSEYVAAKDMTVVINREQDTGKVTIISIDDQPYGSGVASTTVTNVPDSGVGSLTFKKYGDSEAEANLIGGGEYQLYRVVEGGNGQAVEGPFSTVNGIKTFNNLPYGTYYVQEITAPAGYLIQGEETTDKVTLLKTEPHKTVSLVNKRFEDGKITIKKTDEKGDALPGVTFTLTAGGQTISEVTGADGVAEFEDLAAGTYTVTETLPYGYSGFAGPIVVTIDATGTVVSIEGAAGATTIGSDITISWKNIRQFGSIKVTKTGKGGALLQGAEFALYESDGTTQVGDPETTNADGVAEFTGLPYGDYILKETAAPAGYVLSAQLSAGVTVKVDSAAAVTLTYSNDTRKGSIEITKKAAESSAPLPGATFGLYSDAAATQEIIRKTTGTDGKVVFDGLEAGTYYVKETNAPAGYVPDAEVHAFTIGGDAAEAEWKYEAAIENSLRRYKLKLVKTDETGLKPLSGAEFELTGNGVKQTQKSGTDGAVVFEGLPFGTYTITEIVAPPGYALAAPVTVTIGSGNTPAEYTEDYVVDAGQVRDTHTELTVLKWDDNGTTPLSGATFRIMAGDKYVIAAGSEGKYTYSGLSDSAADATQFVTGGSGTFILEYIPMGRYTLEETAAPDGYIIATDSENFIIDDPKTSVSVKNTRIKAALKLVKSDSNGKLLEGVSFVMRDSATGKFVVASGSDGVYAYTGLGEEGTELTTDSRGEIKLDGLLWGTYYLDETVTPEGLVPEQDIPVVVTATKHNTTIALPVVNELKLGEISFVKQNGGGGVLSGAVFKLELVEGTGNSYSVSRPLYAVSDTEGKVSFTQIPYGVYKLTEYLAPAGYELSKEVRYVSVGGAAATEEIELTANPGAPWVNDTTHREVTVKKVSADGKTELSGAVFEVLDKDQQSIGEEGIFIYVNKGETNTVQLPLGVYYLKETKAPDNYVLDETPIRFVVTAEGPNEIVVKNVPYTGSLTITKKDAEDGEKFLSGAEFKVYEQNDYETNGTDATALYTVTTNSDGKVTLTGIPFGDYAVRETRAPAGYELSDEVKYFSITNAGEGGSASTELTFEDQKSRYALGITKVDINTRQLLSGAKFAVSGNGFYVEVAVGEDGTATVEVPVMGVYYITEIAAPNGYTIDPKSYSVKVTGHTAVGEKIAAQFVSEDYPTAVKLKKVDEKGELLAGARFSLYGLDSGEEQPVALSGSNGAYAYSAGGGVTEIEIPEDGVEILGLPAGSYLLRETDAPDGYMVLGDIPFSVDPGRYDEALELTAENMPHQKGVAVCKEDKNGVRLAGAEFGLYTVGGTDPVETAVTSAAGYAVFTGLTVGEYFIKEISAPAGYTAINTEYKFSIDGEGVLTGGNFVQLEGEAFFVLTVKNDPVEHSFRLCKVSAASDNLTLSGAEFRIIGEGVNRIFVTGEDGLTENISLPIGEYTLTEQKAPAGYVADGTGRHIQVTTEGVYIDGILLTDEAPAYTVKNTPQSFRLRIVKQDKDSGIPLSGVAFSVTGADGEKHSLVTDDHGMTETISLAPGKYAVSETIAAAGYNLPLTGWSFTVSEGAAMQATGVEGAEKFTFEGGLLTVWLANEMVAGSLKIYKFDADDKDAALEGAKFEVFDSESKKIRFALNNGIYTVSDATGAEERLVTNAMGIVLLQNLPFGEYTVKEVEAPEGYAVSTEDSIIKLTRQSETLALEVSNKRILRTVTVLKQSAGEEPQALVGATFALYSTADGSRTFISEATTGYDGKARFAVPYGSYIIVETRAPEGYELSGREPAEFIIDGSTADGQEFLYTFSNEESRYAIEIYKHDADDDGKALAGAEFAVTDSRGFTKTVTTGADGRAVLEGVAYDDYTIREIKAPKGYRISEETYNISRRDLVHGKAVEIRVPNNYILGTVKLKKADHEDPAKTLDGAEFILTDELGNKVRWDVEGNTYTLNSNGGTETITAGSVILEKLPEGKYTLTETKAPAGYVPLDEAREFSITAENADAGLEIAVENLLRRTAVGIIKIDEAQHELRLSGAEFTLYRLKDGKEDGQVSVAVTNHNGIATFTDLTMGLYRLKETKAPDGYKLWDNPIDFQVDEYGKVKVGSQGTALPEVGLVYTASVTNKAITKEVTLKKVSAVDGAALPGATFRFTGDKTYDITTGADGTAKVTLTYGSYILQEIIAPDGYVLDDARTAVVVDSSGIKVNGKAQAGLTVTIKNNPVEYGVILHKQDSVSGKALGGASFVITGGKTYTLTTNSAGNTATVYLAPGTYAISETRVPDGYARPLNGWTLTVREDGRMTVSGGGASIAFACGITMIAVENTPNTSVPLPGPSSDDIAKTGQGGNSGQLLCGASLMLLSFAGMLLLVLGKKRDGQYIEI